MSCLESKSFCIAEECVSICRPEWEIGCHLGSKLKVSGRFFATGIGEILCESHVAQFLTISLPHAEYTYTYVHWTVHHLESRIKMDQLDVICFIISLFNAQHVSNVSTSILRSLRLIC